MAHFSLFSNAFLVCILRSGAATWLYTPLASMYLLSYQRAGNIVKILLEVPGGFTTTSRWARVVVAQRAPLFNGRFLLDTRRRYSTRPIV